jgi:hypothetical protein
VTAHVTAESNSRSAPSLTIHRSVRNGLTLPYSSGAVKGSVVDGVEPAIRALLKEFPEMPATVIAERIGWDRSMTVIKERVRELRPVYAPVDPASRTSYGPGERAQCDLWVPPAPIPLGFGQVDSPPLLVMMMMAGYSRWLCAKVIPTRNAEDLVLGQCVEKPSAAFFDRVVTEAGCRADQVLYVGDRLDNGIRPAQEVGIATALIRRGPWGYILNDKAVSERCLFQLDSLADLPELLRKHNESAA